MVWEWFQNRKGIEFIVQIVEKQKVNWNYQTLDLPDLILLSLYRYSIICVSILLVIWYDTRSISSFKIFIKLSSIYYFMNTHQAKAKYCLAHNFWHRTHQKTQQLLSKLHLQSQLEDKNLQLSSIPLILSSRR